MLLFDELVFLTRSLCPENLRAASFVRFLDEEGGLPTLEDLEYERLRDALGSSDFDLSVSGGFPHDYWAAVQETGVHWEEPAPDNHSHGLRIGGGTFTARSADPLAVAFDLFTLERIGDESLELVTNSFVQLSLEHQAGTLAERSFVEALILSEIDNYLTPDGPYHAVVDEVREERSLRDFRNWVASEDWQGRDASELVADVDATLRDAQERLFLEQLDTRGHYKSTGKVLAGALADVLLPGSSTVAALTGELRSIREKKNAQWQAFIIKARRSLRAAEGLAGS